MTRWKKIVPAVAVAVALITGTALAAENFNTGETTHSQAATEAAVSGIRTGSRRKCTTGNTTIRTETGRNPTGRWPGRTGRRTRRGTGRPVKFRRIQLRLGQVHYQ